MIRKTYATEREGQIDFYESYLPLIDGSLLIDDILGDNNDGVLKGNILEFKIMINDPNSVLFQTIKYLSARRVKGKPVPKNILLISLNDSKAYLYNSEDYLIDIEKIYSGGSSKNNKSFICRDPKRIINFNYNPLDEKKLIDILKENKFTKINIDDNCIVGWAKKYYKEYPSAKKSDFIGDLTGKNIKVLGEIRNPYRFKEYIHPYEGETNVRFNYLMDKLNDDIQKKTLGAFYTPDLYAQKSLELVRQAIQRVPEGNDYVIIDRCSGTGNLERGLTDEELSHCILSTYEYYEYKVLVELLGDKVRYIIPPTEKKDTFDMGLVRGADALSEGFVNSEIIMEYVNNPKTSIILFENPPYSETTSIEHQKNGSAKENSTWKNSFIVKKMKDETKGTVSNDMGNAFIWSAFKYYLRQPTDSYIVYSPVKYWKVNHLINKRFLDGLAFNRKHFHTSIDACIMVALWSNEDDNVTEEINLKAFNIINEGLKSDGILSVKRIYNKYSEKYYDKTKYEDDMLNGIAVELSGIESFKDKSKIRVKKIFNENILGYMVANQSGFDNPDLNSGLTTCGIYAGNGFFLRKENYLEKLPMFSASRYITYNRLWTQRTLIMKSADGTDKFNEDVNNKNLEQFLLKNMLFCSLEMKNHMRSFIGSDGREYRNELCLDTNNGMTIAVNDLKKLIKGSKEKELLLQWAKVLKVAKKTEKYKKDITYGVYQIWNELNTSYKDGKKDITIYDYPELNGHLLTLKSLVKDYYLTEIVPTLFEYEFLK